METSQTLRRTDVLPGRGKVGSEGNKLFRQAVAENLNTYRNFHQHYNRVGTSSVVNKIIDKVHASGGRFLEQDWRKNWIELSPQERRQKVDRAFRDAIKNSNATSKNNANGNSATGKKSSRTQKGTAPASQPDLQTSVPRAIPVQQLQAMHPTNAMSQMQAPLDDSCGSLDLATATEAPANLAVPPVSSNQRFVAPNLEYSCGSLLSYQNGDTLASQTTASAVAALDLSLMSLDVPKALEEVPNEETGGMSTGDFSFSFPTASSGIANITGHTAIAPSSSNFHDSGMSMDLHSVTSRDVEHPIPHRLARENSEHTVVTGTRSRGTGTHSQSKAPMLTSDLAESFNKSMDFNENMDILGIPKTRSSTEK